MGANSRTQEKFFLFTTKVKWKVFNAIPANEEIFQQWLFSCHVVI